MAVAACFVFQPVNPCSAISAGEGYEDVRYLTETCVTCCRGPADYKTYSLLITSSALLYVLSWFGGWALDSFIYCEDTSEIDLVSM